MLYFHLNGQSALTLVYEYGSGRASSIGTILAGSIYYTWVKHIESAPPKYEKVPLEEVEAGNHHGHGHGHHGNGKPE